MFGWLIEEPSKHQIERILPMNISLRQENLPACLWMQAGVVPKKLCQIDFACNICKFDKALNRVCLQNKEMKRIGMHLPTKRTSLEFWQDRLQKMPLAKRPCVHHMKGHIDFKNCPKAYHCVDCEFDQYFHDQFKVNAVLKPVNFNKINGVSLPTGFYLHPGHTWVKIEDQGMVRVGIDDFACRLLGGFDKINVPLMGKTLVQGKPGFSLSRDNHKVDFTSPVNGVITEVNKRIEKSPDLINQSPYENGWIFMLYCPDLKKDLKNLMFMEGSKGYINTEVKRLYEFLEEETQMKAADGGELVPDLYGNLPDVSWDTLLEKFIPQEA